MVEGHILCLKSRFLVTVTVCGWGHTLWSGSHSIVEGHIFSWGHFL